MLLGCGGDTANYQGEKDKFWIEGHPPPPFFL